MKEQEYSYNSEFVTILHDVVGDDDLVVVKTEHGVLEVARKSQLQKKEDSYYYKQAKKRADELRLITSKAEENLDKLADKLVDKALITLSSRMKFNVVFGKDMGNDAGWAIIIADELKKMIKDKSKNTLKDADL